MKRYTIHSKLNIFMFCIIFLIVFIGIVSVVFSFFALYEVDIMKNVTEKLKAFEKIAVVDNENRLQTFSEGLGELSLDLLYNPDAAKEKLIVNEYIKASGNDRIEYIRVIGGNRVFNLKKKNNYQELEKMFLDIEEDNPKESLYIDGNSKLGLFAFCVSPILDANGKLCGTVFAAMNLANQDDVEYIKNAANMEATIFAGNKRIATTIIKDGKSIVNTTLDERIENLVIRQGKSYQGEARILGDPYLVSYKPLYNGKNQPVGILFVGKSTASLVRLRNQIIVSVIFVGLFLVIVFFILSEHWIRRHVSDPIEQIADSMRRISLEDYSALDTFQPTKTKEIDMLQSAMKTMVRVIAATKRKLEILAYYDPFTNLPNRTSLFEKYRNISLIRNPGTLTVMYYLDVDNLKYINILFGHDVGDGVLKQIAEILREMMTGSSGYKLYRIDSDEFVICREGAYEISQIIDFANELQRVFGNAFRVNQHNISLSVSIGISYTNYCDGSKCAECTGKCKYDLETLLKKAEAAMHQVKSKGKNSYQLYDQSMSDQMQRRAALGQDLSFALKREEILIHYQPKYNMHRGDYDCFEALVRWKHPIRGFVPPSEFIKIAEESNLIMTIGEWVLENSCLFLKELNQKLGKKYSIAVNISAIQLLSEGFEEMVCAVLERTGLDPAFLELEITESVFINSMEIANEKLKFLRQKNITIALDDFGTGYSSLTYLKMLPITTVKLDKSFVDDIAVDSISLNIVDNVIQISKNIGLKTVVEGVETEEQLQILQELHCDYIQGYYFSKPLPGEEIYRLLQKE